MDFKIDLRRYGVATGILRLLGTLKSSRLNGNKLLFLFGDRHSIRPYVRRHLLNTIELLKFNAISCVGMEGLPSELPGACEERDFEDLVRTRGSDADGLIHEMLRPGKLMDHCYWRLLRLLRPTLSMRSIEDVGLFHAVAPVQTRYAIEREEQIRSALRDDELFTGCDLHGDRPRRIEAKVSLQWEYEFAEEEVNVKRDGAFISNMMNLWREAGEDKPAILFAGSSHQYRIARSLPLDVDYCHVEQP